MQNLELNQTFTLNGFLKFQKNWHIPLNEPIFFNETPIDKINIFKTNTPLFQDMPVEATVVLQLDAFTNQPILVAQEIKPNKPYTYRLWGLWDQFKGKGVFKSVLREHSWIFETNLTTYQTTDNQSQDPYELLGNFCALDVHVQPTFDANGDLQNFKLNATHYKTYGFYTEPHVERLLSLDQHQLPYELKLDPIMLEKEILFSQQQLNALLADPLISDLTKIPFATIDAESTTDIDDAIYFDLDKKTLYVAIADVSSFIKPNTYLDAYAKQRATSAYFPGSVYHMLPSEISENICSLVAHKTRMAIVAKLSINTDTPNQWYVENTNFERAKIKVHQRLSYKQVDAFLDHTRDPYITKDPITPTSAINLINLNHLANNIPKNPETLYPNTDTYFKLNPQGKIESIHLFEAMTPAHEAVQTSMILINQAAAKMLNPQFGIFRNQLKPKLPDHIQDPDAQAQFIKAALRPAFYSEQNEGHFGMGLNEYVHFSSPIRRYSDLIAHRLLINSQEHQLPVEQTQALMEHLNQINQAVKKATTQTKNLLLCEYAQKLVGKNLLFKVVDQMPSGCLFLGTEIPITTFIPWSKLLPIAEATQTTSTINTPDITKENFSINSIHLLKIKEATFDKIQTTLMIHNPSLDPKTNTLGF